MSKANPLTARTVLAISDARRFVLARLEADGLCALDREALLLLDTSAYIGARADLSRRASDVLRDTGELTPWIERQGREIERDFAHVALRDAA